MHTFGNEFCDHCGEPTCEKTRDEFDYYYDQHCKDCMLEYWILHRRHSQEIAAFNAKGIARRNAYLKRLNEAKK